MVRFGDWEGVYLTELRMGQEWGGGVPQETWRRRIRKTHERVTKTTWQECLWVVGVIEGERGR